MGSSTQGSKNKSVYQRAGFRLPGFLGAQLYANNKDVSSYRLSQVSLPFVRDHKG